MGTSIASHVAVAAAAAAAANAFSVAQSQTGSTDWYTVDDHHLLDWDFTTNHRNNSNSNAISPVATNHHHLQHHRHHRRKNRRHCRSTASRYGWNIYPDDGGVDDDAIDSDNSVGDFERV